MFFLILICLIWLLCLVPTLCMMIFTKLTCWLWAALFYPLKDFPFLLAWLGQYDDNLDAEKDPGWWNKDDHPIINKFEYKGFWKWVVRTCWIWRNPSQYFDYWIVGQVIKQISKTVIYGDPAVRDDSPFKAGYCLKLLYTEDRTIPYLRLIWKWPFWEKCIDIKLGYAVWENVKQGDRAKMVFSLGLFSKITR